ncbi:MAG: serine hydrolase [Oscillospiraceae bacterium]|nr:serine hydrolase [Oscillospiraceae bacterium]
MKRSKEAICISISLIIIAFCAGFVLTELLFSRDTGMFAEKAGNMSESGVADTGTMQPQSVKPGYSETTAPANAAEADNTAEAADGTVSADSAEGAGDTGPAAAVPYPEAPVSRLDSLESDINAILSGKSGIWDVYIEDIASGESISCTQNPPTDGKMISASIIKIFVMAAVYDQIDKGVLSEDEVYDDLYAMITVSDNDATNRLVEKLGGGDSAVGLGKVTAYANSVGCYYTQMLRLMLDWSDGLENYVSAKDCAKLLKMIYRGECVSSERSDEMLSLLLAQQKNEGLKWNIPEDVLVASKPGYISGVSIGDVGIVISENSYIICAICNSPASDDSAKQTISDISTAAYGFFTGAQS